MTKCLTTCCMPLAFGQLLTASVGQLVVFLFLPELALKRKEEGEEKGNESNEEEKEGRRREDEDIENE